MLVERCDLSLTTDERECCESLSDAWNSAVQFLGGVDREEFKRAIHAAQHIIALQVARRVDPDFWRSH